MTGPVQVLVLGFEEPRFSGEVLAELERLRAAGVVRLVDVLLLSRAGDGTFETLPPPPGADAELGRVAAEILGGPDASVPERHEVDTWSLEDAIPPGRTGAVALIEHTWAQPLVDTIRSSGGHLLDETWLAPADLERLQDAGG